MSNVLIYTDGASKGNPGPGGWGAIVATLERVIELGGFEDRTTNNRMELQAVHEALLCARQFEDAQITIYTDSSYVMNGATVWGRGWKARGWITKDNKPVLNRDMWEPFLALVADFGTRIQWENVGGHIGVVGNERVDAIASGYALNEPIDLYDGPRAAYSVDLTDLSFDAEKKAARSASKNRSRGAAYSYVSAVDGKVMVHQSWAECAQRVRGRKARFKKALSPAEQAEIIQSFGG